VAVAVYYSGVLHPHGRDPSTDRHSLAGLDELRLSHSEARGHDSETDAHRPIGEAQSREPAVVCQQPPVVRSAQFGDRRRSRPRAPRGYRNGKALVWWRGPRRVLPGCLIARPASIAAIAGRVTAGGGWDCLAEGCGDVRPDEGFDRWVWERARGARCDRLGWAAWADLKRDDVSVGCEEVLQSGVAGGDEDAGGHLGELV
jgi:hypothetical protein